MKKLLTIVAALTVCCFGCATRDIQSSEIRVMTYNIHHGEGTDKKIDLERIADLIKREKADIVALQEVDRGVERTAGRDLPKELAKLTGLNVYFERNITYQGGDYGNAVLTRYPIKKKKNTHYKMLRPDEQRGVLQVLLKIQGKEVLFMNTHIDYRPDDSERLANADELHTLVTNAGSTPVILCGDFNDTPGSRTYKKINGFLDDTWELVGHGNGFTFPSDNPKIRIDYIWITKSSVQPLKIRVLESDASDHLPVIGEFRLR